MNPMNGIWIASWTAALLFFVAGYLTARRLRAARAAVELPAMPPRRVASPTEPPAAGELAAMREQIAALEASLAGERNRAASLAAELAEARTAPARAASPPKIVPALPKQRLDTERGTEVELEDLLRRIARTPGFRSAAIADDLGLPIVGVGEDFDSLAAFGGYVDKVGAKAREFLELPAIQRIDIVAEDRTTVSACPVSGEDATFILLALTSGPGPTTMQMSRVVRGAAQMF